MSETRRPEAVGGVVTKVEALRFRSLRYLSQPLGPFHVLVGANASGKSSFLDTVAFLGDVVRAGLETAVAGDVRLGIPLRAPDARQLAWMGKSDRFELAIEVAIPEERRRLLKNGAKNTCRYEIAVDVRDVPRIVGETLWLMPSDAVEPPSQRTLFPDDRRAPGSIVRAPRTKTPTGWKKVVSRGETPESVTFIAETSGWNNPFRLGTDKAALASLPEDEERFPVATWFRRVLQEGVQRIGLSGEDMRRPSPFTRSVGYLPDGSNLPHVVHRLEVENTDRFQRWVRHVQEALPDIASITTAEREEDRSRYLTLRYRSGLEAPSWLVSDGTLRLLALTLLAYVPALSGIYLVEEPENGIHPQAVETVLQSLSSVYGAQVLLATHSPVVASLARLDQVLCFGRTKDGASDVVPGSEHPRLREWRGALDIGTLLAAGVLG